MSSSEKQKQWKAEHFQLNKDYHRLKLKRRRIETAIWFYELKCSLKCNRCGFDVAAALLFHHINKEDKKHEVSKMIGEGYSKKSILKEIEKCEVLCGNCHFIHHSTEDIRRHRMKLIELDKIMQIKPER